MTPDDEPRLRELIVESQDLQTDALRGVSGSLADLRDHAAQRRGDELDPADVQRHSLSRRALLRDLRIRGWGTRGLLAGGLGAAVTALLTEPVAADSIDVMILQTASSLERLAVNTYGVALTLPFIAGGNPVVKAFATTTMGQHDQHRQAFQAQTTALGGTAQDAPNPKYAAVVAQQKPLLTTPLDVVNLAMTLENVARDTYLADLAMFTDTKSKALMASVMGVETQHLAVLRAVSALLGAGAPGLVAIPVDAGKLPAVAGNAGFSTMSIPVPEKASPPSEGALS